VLVFGRAKMLADWAMPILTQLIGKLVAVAVGAESWLLTIAMIEVATLKTNFSHHFSFFSQYLVVSYDF